MASQVALLTVSSVRLDGNGFNVMSSFASRLGDSTDPRTLEQHARLPDVLSPNIEG